VRKGKGRKGMQREEKGRGGGIGKEYTHCPLTMRAIPKRLRDALCGGVKQIDYLYLSLHLGKKQSGEREREERGTVCPRLQRLVPPVFQNV